MPTRTIQCRNCAIHGEIEVLGLKNNVPLSNLFRHLGHNPYSGDMHYQCPACGMVLMVSPMAVLGEGAIHGNSWTTPSSISKQDLNTLISQ